MHLLLCAHFINIFLFLGLLNLDILSIRNAKGCLVCVICDSSSFHSFIFKDLRGFRGYFGPLQSPKWKLLFTNFILLIY